MKELIYAGIKVQNLVKKQFPDAKTTDASDDLHEERFEIKLDVPEKEFYQFAIENGFAGSCLGFCMRMMQDDSEVKSWVQELLNRPKEKHCPNCDSILDSQGNHYICHGCGQVYPITEGSNVQPK